MPDTTPPTATDALVTALARHGSDTVFGVPGGGVNLALIGAAERAGMRFVLTHGETAGAIAAATYGLLTGAPAMALATRGPGAASAVNGAAQATLDRYPLVLATDCVSASDTGRVAHQRLDQTGLLRPVTKWSGTIGDDAGAPATAEMAVSLAARPPRGAVHLDVDPGAPSTPPDADGTRADGNEAPGATGGGATDERLAGDLEAARRLLADARRPVAIVGFEAIDQSDEVRTAVERLGCPTLTTYQAIGVLSEGHPQLAGLFTGGVIEQRLLARADLVIAIGLDTVEPLPTPWPSTVPVISIVGTTPASSYVPSDVSLHAPLSTTLTELLDRTNERCTDWPPDAGAEALADVRQLLRGAASDAFGPLELATAVAEVTPPTATATVDAGAHFLAVMPFWPANRPLGLLISNGLATMGFALPAAIGAALARPGAPVVCMVGDGGLGMTLAELETVARLHLPITVVVFDDAALSLIEVKQREGHGGPDAVRYRPIDFAAVAGAMGLDATAVDDATGLRRVLADGWDRPRLVDARIDPSPYRRLIETTRG